MNMKLEFFKSALLRFDMIMCYQYKTVNDDNRTIDKIYYDKPLCFDEMCAENLLTSLDIDKEFNTELDMKNWLMARKYSKMFGNEEYEIFSFDLTYCKISEGYNNFVIPLIAVWRKI